MDANEARVREVWVNIGVYGYGFKTRYVNLADVPKEFCGVDETAAWSAAAAYTETVLREVAELREEIAAVQAIVDSFVTHGGATFKRILARLEAIYAAHMRGLKPEALERMGQ